jgi:hypothetical protein
MSKSIKSLQRKAKEVMDDIERHSKPVSQQEVKNIVTLMDPEMADRLANAKQGSLF